jgi:nicotinate dehydrogenase subunit B
MNEENFLELDFRGIGDALSGDRRDFLKTLGGGIFVFLALGDAEALAQAEGRRGMAPRTPNDFNAFLRIGEDGRVSCFTGKIEMGQGIITSLAQMLADELDVPLDRVDMVMGDTELCPWDMGTFGSMSTRFFGPPLRGAAAVARRELLQLAAEHFKLPADELAIEQGEIFPKEHRDNRVGYAALTRGKRIERHLSQAAALKAAGDFHVVGKPVVRRDGRDKVTGKAKYAADIRLPGMLCAKLLRPPVHGAKLKSVDTSAAAAVEGVRIVQEGDLVAVLHERPDVAENALKQVRAEFDLPQAHVDSATIFDHLLKVAPQGRTVVKGGDLDEGKKLAAHLVEATYLNSYVAHAALEPHAAVVQIEEDRATVWASTQNPFTARDEVARAIGFPKEQVRLITPFVGGGFGGKTFNKQAVEAARLAKAVGRPVQVAWNRAEEFFFDTFRPAAIVKIRSGVDQSGRIVLWDYHAYFGGEREAKQFYDVPNHSTVCHGGGFRSEPGTHPFATGAWRGPGTNTNTHARESHIDLMAAKAGIDPVEFRLKNLKDRRMLRVLKTAAEKFGWTPHAASSGKGLGVACAIDSGSYVTLMAEVGVDKETGRVKVKRMLCVQDMGLVINPEGAKIQMEGCLTMGLGYTLAEEIRFRGGDVLDRNFDTYHLPQFSWLPKIETVLIDVKDAPPQGGGEPPIVATGAVIANAVFDAVGVRLFLLPMTPERVKAAIAKGASA